MVTAEELAARAAVISDSPDLSALRDELRRRAQPVLERMPPVPDQKALLSMDGGVCPEDGALLVFDPWSPSQHRCPRCGRTWQGERHNRNWAWSQHLWLAERAAHLAVVAALGGQGGEGERATARAQEILTTYGERYWRFPNRDNVLGPSRLFFSTYIESIWTCNYLVAAMLLRAAGRLDPAVEKSVNRVVEEAATLIGDYDEGFSNRQTWNNAALAAVAVWFEDEELAQRAIEGDAGLIAHLVRGYGRDGMWYEGENYHLFALRGLLIGTGWARLAGVDITADERLAARLRAALLAPALTALPDFTRPARKDSRFGISLAQPAHVELWEVGLGRLADPETARWLQTVYHDAPPPVLEHFEYYLHDAPLSNSPPPTPVSRASLSWWSLLEMMPALEAPAEPWHAGSLLLESQGVAVLRHEDRYVSLEAGPTGGGHGHPDRLHLTLHARGVHWLPDPGTGRYVTRDLFWYRSTLAHNAPRLDGESQTSGHASCVCFDVQDDWGWVRGRFETLNRIVTAGPSYIVDITDQSAREDHVLELPWHLGGRGSVETPGRWVSDELADDFVTRVQRFEPHAPGAGPILITHVQDGARLMLHLLFDGALLEIEGPGLPGRNERVPFYVVRAAGRNLRIVAVIEPLGLGDAVVRGVQRRGDSVEVATTAGIDRHRFTGSDWTIEREGRVPLVLRGAREPRPPFVPLLQIDPPTRVAGPAFRVSHPPPLDGSLDGFELAEPLQLSLEDQYRRSEDAYPGPEDLSATAYAGWDEQALYLAVAITKPELCLRPQGAPPLQLDNEPDDIHSDGLQVYVAPLIDAASPNGGRTGAVGYLIVPEEQGRRVRSQPTSDTHAQPTTRISGGWQRTETGYCVTVAIPWPEGAYPHAGGRVAFDLIVNELLPGRVRRVGQLVWSGGGGWVWLRGDRQDPARFGVLELVG